MGIWRFGAGDGKGVFAAFRVRSPFPGGEFLSTEAYPRVYWMRMGIRDSGMILPAGKLAAHPGNVRDVRLPWAVIRFEAPEAGEYEAALRLAAAEIGYGGTTGRLIRGEGEVLAQFTLAREYGSHWEYRGRVRLREKEALSICVGPSVNGDHASDTTEVVFQMRTVEGFSGWGVFGGILAAGAAGIWWRRVSLRRGRDR